MVNNGNLFNLNGQTLNVARDLDNNGTFVSTSGTLAINGAQAQQIQSSGGTGVWSVSGNTGRILNLTISNTVGGVTLNSNTSIAVQNLLSLTSGVFTATTLTVGIPATGVTVNRNAGSLANVPTFNYTTGAYAITYGTAQSYTVLNELPASTTPTNGILTVNISGATVTLDKNANIGRVATVTGGIFNVNNFTLGLSDATPVNNVGTLTSNGASSILNINGTVAQTLTTGGTITGTINQITIANTNASGVVLGGTVSTAFFVVNNGSLFNLNGQTLNVARDLDNNGTFVSTSGTLAINGAQAQQIQSSGGTGVWSVSANTGRILNLTISNTVGGVTLNSNTSFAVQNLLSLTSGVFTATTLTIGIPATGVTVNRNAGSLANVPTFNYTTGAYAITYGTAQSYTVLNELPASTTPTNGILTVNISGATVTLDKNANIGRVATVTGGIFNLNNFTLGLSDATPVNNVGTLTSNGASSILNINGTVAQTLTTGGTITGTINQVTIANTNASGVVLGGTVSTAFFIVNNGSLFNLNGQTLNVARDLDNNGTFVSTSGTLAINGAQAQQIQSSGGTGVWSVSANTGRLLNLTISNTVGGVTLNSNTSFAVQNLLSLTSGVFTATTLTIGVPATGVTVNRNAGSLANAPSFNFTTGAYAITYGTAQSYTVLNELPASTTPTNGILTVNISGATVMLDKNANIGRVATVTGGIFNVNNFTLGLSDATPVNNVGTLTSNGSTSILTINGTIAQTLTTGGTITGTINQVTIANSNASGVVLGGTVSVGFLTINNGSLFNLNGQALNVARDIDNNGTFVSTSGTLTINGSVAQTIQSSGSTGVWSVSGTAGRLLNLTINNSTNSNINLNSDIAIQNNLTLTNGVLTGTSTNFTIGVPSTAVSMTRTAGSVTLPTAFAYGSGVYTVTYGTGANVSFTTGNEVPATSTAAITGGLTMNTTSGGTVTLNKSITVNGTWTSTSGVVSIGANVLTMNGALSYTAGNFVGGTTSDIVFGGSGAATLVMNNTTPGTTNVLQNLTVNRAAATVTLTTNALIVNNTLTLAAGTLSLNGLALTLNGTIAASPNLGTITPASGTLNIAGSSSSMGTINIPTGTQAFAAINFTNSSTTNSIGSPTLTLTGPTLIQLSATTNALVVNGGVGSVLAINSPLTFTGANTTFSLTNGVVSMGNNVVTYTNTSAASATFISSANTANANSYFAFIGANSGFAFNTSVATSVGLILNWPIGVAGTVTGFRPVTIQTLVTASNPSSVNLLPIKT